MRRQIKKAKGKVVTVFVDLTAAFDSEGQKGSDRGNKEERSEKGTGRRSRRSIQGDDKYGEIGDGNRGGFLDGESS